MEGEEVESGVSEVTNLAKCLGRSWRDMGCIFALSRSLWFSGAERTMIDFTRNSILSVAVSSVELSLPKAKSSATAAQSWIFVVTCWMNTKRSNEENDFGLRSKRFPKRKEDVTLSVAKADLRFRLNSSHVCRAIGNDRNPW